jgi:hypothetical protein
MLSYNFEKDIENKIDVEKQLLKKTNEIDDNDKFYLKLIEK